MNNRTKIFILLTLLIMVTFLTGLAARGIAAIHRALSSAFYPPLVPLTPRKCDSFGCGNYGASRDGGKRRHKGQDFLCSAGQTVYAPIDGTVTTGAAYADGRSPELRLVRITDGPTVVLLMYVRPTVQAGHTVQAGDPIGTAQSLQGRYPGIPDHVHVEVRLSGVSVDPLPYFTPNENAPA